MKKILTVILLSYTPLGVLIGAEERNSIQAPPFEDVLVTTVLTDKGLYNLSVCVAFEAPSIVSGRMSKYNLETYRAYLSLLNKIWKKRVFDTVNKPLIKVSDLDSLKYEVSTAMLELIEEHKVAYKIPGDAMTVFNITHFFLSGV